MIVCQLIDRIEIGTGYKADIYFNAGYQQFFNDTDIEAVKINTSVAV